MKNFPLFMIVLMALQLNLNSCSSKSMDSRDVSSEFVADEENSSATEEGVVVLGDDLFETIDDNVQQASQNEPQEEIQAEPENIAETEPIIESQMEYSNEFSEYTVEEGDTLMWISYKLYGDYRQWRKLKAWNEKLLDSKYKPEPGSKLSYQSNNSQFNWRGEGNPYLVLRGDTLFKISRKVYEGQGQLWRSIWKNNQTQIQDPDLIFAGFTLFYLPYEQVTRDIASNGKN